MTTFPPCFYGFRSFFNQFFLIMLNTSYTEQKLHARTMKRSGVGPRRSSSFILPRATPTLLNYVFRRQSLKPTIIKQKKNVIREKKDFRSVERPFAHRHSLCNTPKHPINTEKTKSVLTTPLLKGMFVQKKNALKSIF